MTRSRILLAALAGLLAIGLVGDVAIQAAASCNLRQAGFGETRQQKRKCQGKNCPGVNTPWDCGTENVEITPSPVRGKAGQPVEIRFDASSLCNGQSFKNFVGSVQWEAASTCGLQGKEPTYGAVSYTYSQGGNYTASFDMSYICYDEGQGYHQSVCKSKGTTPVRIDP